MAFVNMATGKYPFRYFPGTRCHLLTKWRRVFPLLPANTSRMLKIRLNIMLLWGRAKSKGQHNKQGVYSAM